MPFVSDFVWLIPAIPISGASFLFILWLSFPRTMNRLSKPISAILISCFSSSAIISYLFLKQEYKNEFTQNVDLNSLGLHTSLIFDKISSISLTSICTIILLCFALSYYSKSGKQGYVSILVYLGLIGSSILLLPISSLARQSFSILS